MDKSLLLDITQELENKFETEIEVQHYKPVGGGCISNTLKLETNLGDFFVKWNSNCPEDLFVREAEGLSEMADVDNPYLKVPHAILSKEAGYMPGYLVLEFLDSGSRGDDDENLGIGLSVLHRKSAQGFGFYHNNYCGATTQNNKWNSDWIDFFGRQRIWFLLEMIKRQRHISSGEMNIYEKLIKKLPELIGHQPVPSLIHGDLWSGNYMRTASGPSIIDPATHYADREMEFSIMSMFGGFSQRVWSSYQNSFPFPSGWQERIKLYQLYHYLNHYYLFGGSYGSYALNIARFFI